MNRVGRWAVLAAVLLAGGSAQAAGVLWGVTNGTGDAGGWTGGQIFTVDTTTGAVSIKASYGSGTMKAFGDIALSPSGEVYVTYYGDDGFDKVAKVNTTTWAFDWVQDLGGWSDQVNALNFVQGRLYGVTGGGTGANLIAFNLVPGGVTATNLGNIGINSDGDLARDPISGAVYYTSWSTGNTGELNVIDLAGPSLASTLETNGSGWSGIEFTSDGTLWAGTYWDQKLYTIDPATGLATPMFDLSGALGGPITGLSIQVPAPAAAWLVSLGACLVRGLRRRRAL